MAKVLGNQSHPLDFHYSGLHLESQKSVKNYIGS